MLHELERLVERAPETTAEDYRQAAALLLARQFIHLQWANDPERAAYRLIIRNLNYFQNLFWAVGWQLYYDKDFAYVGLLPGDDEAYRRLRKDETLVLLIARLLYEEGVEHFQAAEGTVRVDSEELLGRYETFSNDHKRPVLTRYTDIIALLVRHGIFARDGEDAATGLPRLRVLPTIRLVTGSAYLDRVEAYLNKAGQGESLLTRSEDDAPEETAELSDEDLAETPSVSGRRQGMAGI